MMIPHQELPITVHMVLIDAFKESEAAYPSGGFTPRFITLSLSKAKEFLKKAKEGFIKNGQDLELDTTNHFIVSDGKWVTHMKIYSEEMDKPITESDYGDY